MSTRSEKVAQLLKEEISKIITRQLKDPRIGFVTVTKVELTEDLKLAKIYISILEEDGRKKERTKEGLKRALGFIKRMIGKQVYLRYVPDLVLKWDESVQYSLRLEQIFKQIEEDKKGEK